MTKNIPINDLLDVIEDYIKNKQYDEAKDKIQYLKSNYKLSNKLENMIHDLEKDLTDPIVSKKKKPCPYCGEKIQESARKCRYCGEILNNDSEDNLANKQSNNSKNTFIIIIQIVFGLFALVTLTSSFGSPLSKVIIIGVFVGLILLLNKAKK